MKTVAARTLNTLVLFVALFFGGTASAQIYSYDNIGRLETAVYPNGASIAYTYDPNGNITRISHVGVAAPLPPDGVIDTPDDDLTITVEESVDFTATAGDPDGALPLSFRWDFDDGAPESTDEDPGLTAFNTVGVFTVRFHVTDATGLTDPTPDSVVVTVEAAATPPSVNPPPTRVRQSSGGGSVLWLPLMLLLVRLRRHAINLVLIGSLACAAIPSQAAEWAPMNSPTAVDLNDVWGSSSDAVFAVGDQGTILFFDGANWSPMNSGVGVKLSGVFGRSATDVYAVGAQGTVLHYDGNSWTPIDIGAGVAPLIDVWSPGPSEFLYVVAKRGAWYFDGSNWIQRSFTEFLTVSFTPNATLTSIGGTAAFPIVTSVPTGATDGGFFVQFKRIAEWRTNGIWAFSDTEMFAVGEQSRRLDGSVATNNSGVTWRTIQMMDRPLDVWGSSTSDVFSVGGHFGTGRIDHYDGNVDDRWDSAYEVMGRLLLAVYGFGPNDVFVVGEGGTILRFFASPPPATAANFPYSGMASDFVNARTGELLLEEQDFGFGHVLPVTFERYYASGLINDPRVGGLLGRNWTHTYEWRLIEGDNNGTPQVTIITYRGRIITFEQNGLDWNLTSPLSSSFSLALVGTEYLFADPDAERILRFRQSDGDLLSMEDRNGNRVYLNYNEGVLASVDDRKGNEIIFVYSNLNELGGIYTLGTVTDPIPRFDITFDYINGNLSQVTDAAGHTTTYEYLAGRETDALLVATHLPLSTDRRWIYDDKNRVTATLLTDGGDYLYDYGVLSTDVTDPNGLKTALWHDDNGALIRNADALGNVTTFDYDANGRPVKRTDRLGRVTSWTYHAASGKAAVETRPDGLSQTNTYAQGGSSAGVPFYDLVVSAAPDGSSQTFTYDQRGNFTTWTDQENNTWTYTYDAMGNVMTASNPAGGVTEYQYRPSGAIQSITDDAGNVTRFFYDGYQRVVKEEHADGSSKSFTWDERSAPVSATTENGDVVTYTYNEDGSLLNTTTADGALIKYSYNAAGAMSGITDGRGGLRQVQYDNMQRPLSFGSVSGNLTSFGYDALGRLNSVTDSMNQTWGMTFNAENVPTAYTMPGGDQRSFDSSDNQLEQITTVTEGRESASFLYDQRGRIRGLIDGNEGVHVFGRDARGLLTSVAMPGGQVSARFERSSLGEIIKTTDPNGQEWLSEHDRQGRNTLWQDPLGNQTRHFYDSRGRVQRSQYPGVMGDVELSYDATGNLVSTRQSDGTTLDLDYDSLGRIVGGTGISFAYDLNGNMTDSNGIVIGYDADDRIERVVVAAGKEIQYRYDERGHITEIQDWLGGITRFVRNARGQVSRIDLPNNTSTAYQYDAAGRVTSINYGAHGSIAIQRDLMGAVTGATRALPGQQSFESLQRNMAFDAASQVQAFAYDGLGRLVQDNQRNYQWNLASQLLSYTAANGVVNMTYDALGQRTARNDPAGNRSYVWNDAFGRSSPMIERNGGQDLRYNVYTPSGILLYRVEAAGARQYYHFDEAGNTVFMTNDNQAVIATYIYSPYGEILNESGVLENDFTFAGRFGVMREAEDGLYYMRARFYDAKTGRFISRGPLLNTAIQRLNRYQYATGNPLLFQDPSGGSEQSEHSPYGYMQFLRDSILGGYGYFVMVQEAALSGLVDSLVSDVNGMENKERRGVRRRVKALRNKPSKALRTLRSLRANATSTLRALKGLGGVVTVIGAIWTAADENTDMYTSKWSAGGGTLLVTGAALLQGGTPVGALIGMVNGYIELGSTAITGDKMGLLDVGYYNIPRAVAGIFDAVVMGGGWETVRGMTREVKTHQGWAGKAASWAAENIYGPALGTVYSLATGEILRSVALEVQSTTVWKYKGAVLDYVSDAWASF